MLGFGSLENSLKKITLITNTWFGWMNPVLIILLLNKMYIRLKGIKYYITENR